MYVAAVVLQLVDEGLLSLDDPLARFVPGWPKGESITIRMLLSGSSGVASFGAPLDALEQLVAADRSHPWSVEEFTRDSPSEGAPLRTGHAFIAGGH